MNKTIQTVVMATLCLIFKAKAQEPVKPFPLNNQAVIGKVISAATGESLPGAIIKVTTTNQTIVSNDNGDFVLSLSNGSYSLSVHYLNHKTKHITIQIPLKEKLIISLETDDNNLQEVEINAGYYTVKDKERTGSIARVSAEAIAKQPVNNVLGALIGRMPGVDIQQQSGVNGGGFKVEIRGVNSLRSEGRQPLYLVDGVPYPAQPVTSLTLGVGGLSATSSPLNYISPSDIESIEVLKDADATAIYGSRGSNGVILIKTKSAKAGKTTFDLNANTGISKVSSKVKLLNTEQYLEMRNEAFKNDGLNPGNTDYDVNGEWDKNRYTDWQKTLIGEKAISSNIQLAINGGNDATQFSFRGNYSKQGTVSPGDFSDRKVSGNLSVHHTSSNKKFQASFSGIFSKDHNNLPLNDLTQFINLPPNAPALYDNDGNINWGISKSGGVSWENPIASSLNEYNGVTNNLITNALLNYELLPGLKLISSFGYTNIRLRENMLRPIAAQVPSSSATGINQNRFNSIETWIIEPQINFKHKLDKGILDILLGTTFQNDQQQIESISGSGYTSDLLLGSINAAPTRVGSGSSSEYKYAALFGRVNYNYKGKYLINLTGRRDGSSRFGRGRQFANFGAVGLAWIFGEEQFLKDRFAFLSFAKLRGSFGTTGSDQIPDYGYLETYSTSVAYQDGSGLLPSRLANPDYSWETNQKLETTLELGFLNDRIFFTTSFYRNRSSNQLVGYTLPDITGFTNVQFNLPATVQNTGWEFELNMANIRSHSFTWKTAFNLSIPNNKLLSYPNIEGSTYANTYSVGHSLFTPRTFHYTGVNPQTGLYEFQDLNSSGTTDIADRSPAYKALTTHLYGGINNSLSFKGFTLDVFFQFTSKSSRYAFTSFSAPGKMGNQPIQVLNRWRDVGDQASIQKFSQATISNGPGTRFSNLFNSDRFDDSSFIRLKNVALSWMAPAAFVQKVRLTNLRLYIQGQNLLTFTKYPGDPEVLNIKSLPTLRSMTFGIQISL